MAQESFKAMKAGVESLNLTMQSHIMKLQKAAERRKNVEQLEKPTAEFELCRLPIQSHSLEGDNLSSVWKLVEHKEPYSHMMINDVLPTDRKERHQFMSKLRSNGLKGATMLYSCTHTGNHENLHFIWKVNDEEDAVKRQADAIEKVKAETPGYHSKLVKKAFIRKASQLNIKPMCARVLYQLATEDASASENEATREVDARLMEYIRTEDPDIVLDLRSLRTNPEVYEEFFNLAAATIEDTIGTAVDDRRHAAIVHMASAISGAELYRYVALHY